MKVKITTRKYPLGFMPKTCIIPVWRGAIKDGMIWRNGEPDFKRSRLRTEFKRSTREHEELKRRLDEWAEGAGL